ncbi:MAG: DinB family protein [Chitinophagaceae bacterium]
MNQEMQFIITHLKDAYEGDPWFGRSVKAILAEINDQTAFEKFNGQHSIVELIWHMITWREFTISRLQSSPDKDMQYFEEKDWQNLDHENKSLWHQGLNRLQETQNGLMGLLEKQEEGLLEKTVDERKYNFRKLLHGLIQHDIYHLGQIAYIKKITTPIEGSSPLKG